MTKKWLYCQLLVARVVFFCRSFSSKLEVAKEREGRTRPQPPQFLHLTGILKGTSVSIPDFLGLMEGRLFMALCVPPPFPAIFLKFKSRFIPFPQHFPTKFVSVDPLFVHAHYDGFFSCHTYISPRCLLCFLRENCIFAAVNQLFYP